MSSADAVNSGSSGSDPARQLIDLLVYAPIGLLTVAQRELPQLIATGKTRLDNQLTVAKFIGKMAVSQGRKELQRRLEDAERARQAAGPVELISVPELAAIAPSDDEGDAALSSG